jgi:hypothetical protein
LGTVFQVNEFEVGSAREDGFGDIRVGDADTEVIDDGPKSGVEEVGETSGKSQRAF